MQLYNLLKLFKSSKHKTTGVLFLIKNYLYKQKYYTDPCPNCITSIVGPESSLTVEVLGIVVVIATTTVVDALGTLTDCSLVSTIAIILVALPLVVVSLTSALPNLNLLVSTI